MTTFKKTQLWLLPLCLLLVAQDSFCMDATALTTLNGSNSGSNSGSGLYTAVALEAGAIEDGEQIEELTRTQKCKAKCNEGCRAVGKDTCLQITVMGVMFGLGAGLAATGLFASKKQVCNAVSKGNSAELQSCQNDRQTCSGQLATCGDTRDTCLQVTVPGCQGSLTSTENQFTSCSGNLGTCQTDLTAADVLAAQNDADAAMIDACRSGLGGTCGAGCRASISGFLGSSTEVVAVAKAIKAAQDSSGCDAACVAEMTACMTS